MVLYESLIQVKYFVYTVIEIKLSHIAFAYNN